MESVVVRARTSFILPLCELIDTQRTFVVRRCSAVQIFNGRG